MAWPPDPLPIDFTNSTPQEDAHPDAHNDTNVTINDDIAPEVTRLGGVVNQLLLGMVPDFVKNNQPGAGSFTKADHPDGIFVRVMMGGGGGGGGGCTATGSAQASAGGGGGGGGYCETIIKFDDLLPVEDYVIGAGGAGGRRGANPGEAGESSSGFGMTANGGGGGAGAVAVAYEYGNALGGTGGSTSGTRTAFKHGGIGDSPVISGQRNIGGKGGISFFGYNGAGGNAMTAVGTDGSWGTRGQGGGGGANRPSQAEARAGGGGGDGFIWFEVWSAPPG